MPFGAVLLDCKVLHADETPVAMLAPGKGKTHRAYVWTYGSSEHDSLKAVIYEFVETLESCEASANRSW